MNRPVSTTGGARALLKARYRRAGLVTLGLPVVGTLLALGTAPIWPVGLPELALTLGFYLLSVAGLEIGYHRHFAHGAFKAPPAVRVVLAVLGGMAASGPLVYWAATHRLHHAHPDRPGDPHSPYLQAERPLDGPAGFWHAHVGWMIDGEVTNCALYARDLLQDGQIASVAKCYFAWVGLGLIAPALMNFWVRGSLSGAVEGVLWGGAVRIFLVHQLYIGALNSLCHRFGSRAFATDDCSTNHAWLALPTLGQSWHNNHHAFPGSAVVGLLPGQLDLGALVIHLCEGVGLVWDVHRPTPAQLTARSTSCQPIAHQPET